MAAVRNKDESRLWLAGGLAYFHRLDEPVFDAINVLHHSFGKQEARQVADHLMHLHHNCAGGVCVEALWFDYRIDLAPLPKPVLADGFTAEQSTSVGRPLTRHAGHVDAISWRF